jgi:hypothetical protein
MDSQVVDIKVSIKRLDELVRWHGTDESDLPPPHTLEHLSRDTVAALRELGEARAVIIELRRAMGRAFWAGDFRQLHVILLDALGPPPAETIELPHIEAAGHPTQSASSPRRAD